MVIDTDKIKKVLFLLPGPYVYEDRCQTYIRRGSFFSFREPVEEMYAAGALLQKGIACCIIHAAAENLSFQKVLCKIAEFEPDAVILSTTYPGHVKDLAWAGPIKGISKKILIVARGGQMEYVDRSRLMQRFPDLDMIVRGEIEFVLQNLFSNNNSNTVPGLTIRNSSGLMETKSPEINGEIKTLALPARDILKHRLYRSPGTGRPMATIVANRGCPHRCTFCPAPAVMGTSLRLRSVDSVISEMRLCANKFGIRDFFMRGETFTSSREWLLELCQAMASHAPEARWVCNARADTLDPEAVHAMKAAGCWGVSIGAESGCENTLALIKKDLCVQDVKNAVKVCRDNKIMTLAYFMIGFLWETEIDILHTLDFSKKLGSDVVEVFFPYPFPGTELHGSAQKIGLIDDENPMPKTQQEAVFIPQGLTRRRLNQLRDSARMGLVQNMRTARALLRQASDPLDFARIAANSMATAANALLWR